MAAQIGKVTWRSLAIACVLVTTAIASFVVALRLPTHSSTVLNFERLNDLERDRAVLFFGFPQCGDICPTALAKLAQAQGDFVGLFVDIQPYSDAAVANAYVKQFEQSFFAWAPNPAEYHRLRGIFPQEFPNTPYQGQHQGRFYVVQRQQNQWLMVKSLPSQISLLEIDQQLKF